MKKSNNFFLKPFKTFFILLLCNAFLISCETFIRGKEVILPGERVKVIPIQAYLLPERENFTTPALSGIKKNYNWSQPGGNPQNNVGHISFDNQFRTKWDVSIGAGSSKSGRLTATPIIIAGNIYTLDAESKITSFDIKSGKKIWEKSLVPDGEKKDMAFGGGIAADHGMILVTTAFGDIFALDPYNGNVIWNRNLGVPVRASPTSMNGYVYVMSVDNNIHCIDILTGDIKWNNNWFIESAGFLTSTNVAIDNNIVVVPYRSGELFAFNSINGNRLWADSLSKKNNLSSLAVIKDIIAKPVIVKDIVIASGHEGRTVALDLNTGYRLWEKGIASIQTPWVVGETLYMISSDKKLITLDINTGNIFWYKDLSLYEVNKKKANFIQYNGPLVANNKVLILSTDGKLIVLDAKNGEDLNTYDINRDFSITPIIVDDIIYLLSDDANLIALY
ncbi:PQQ-binding-like beta-propeller repeat protein [Hyphomicrobiales bacterium]|nr:PQQ-binding-like beta-propeller repeat protein [Hyphomicrobiales bacterium]